MNKFLWKMHNFKRLYSSNCKYCHLFDESHKIHLKTAICKIQQELIICVENGKKPLFRGGLCLVEGAKSGGLYVY